MGKLDQLRRRNLADARAVDGSERDLGVAGRFGQLESLDLRYDRVGFIGARVVEPEALGRVGEPRGRRLAFHFALGFGLREHWVVRMDLRDFGADHCDSFSDRASGRASSRPRAGAALATKVVNVVPIRNCQHGNYSRERFGKCSHWKRA